MIAQMAAPQVDRHVLAQSWLDHVDFPWDEYGVAIRNLRRGIIAPMSGAFDNWFQCGEGAVIRTELWACLAAGDPELAAKYAYEDACVDHAHDGIWAAVFMAALEAAAFIEHDPDTLLDLALRGLPVSSQVRRVVEDTRRWACDDGDWRSVRAKIVDRYACEDFTDVRANTGFVILGWLAGDSFTERILICNNCGFDTDSTTASLASLLGILDPTSIPREWSEPIGRDLIMSPEIRGITAPATIDDFTDLVLTVRSRRGGSSPPQNSDSNAGETTPNMSRIVAEVLYTDEYTDHQYVGNRFMPSSHGPAPARTWRERSVALSGTWQRHERGSFEGDVLILRYTFRLPCQRLVRVMVNSSEQSRIWLDEEYAFGRDTGGRGERAHVWPSPSHPPLNQSADFDLPAGVHEIVAAIRRPTVERAAEWIVAVADPTTGMWLTDVLTESE